MTNGWWGKIDRVNNNTTLRQGDYLHDCGVIAVNPEFDPKSAEKNKLVKTYILDLIVVTQSCDLEVRTTRGGEKIKPTVVLLSPVYSIIEYTQNYPEFTNKKWEEVRKGRKEGLYLLASTDYPENNNKCLVVDLTNVYSLPYEYLERRTEDLDTRWRLKSPYLEHFAQAFARRFMRVGLPSSIPEFK
jgi:hypothetical protein